MCCLGSNWQYGSIGSDNGLAPNRRQAIIWTDVGMLYGRIYASPGLNELMFGDRFLSPSVPTEHYQQALMSNHN